jgi:hypothetical protein
MVDKSRRAPAPDKEISKPKPLSPLDEYIDVQPALHMVRIMNRFFAEVVDEPPFRQYLSDLHVAYMEILNEELAPYALDLALAITELEDAYPMIDRSPDSPLPPAD